MADGRADFYSVVLQGASLMSGPPRQEGDEATGPARVAPDSDESLLRRFRLGDEDAAALLYHKYASRLRAVGKVSHVGRPRRPAGRGGHRPVGLPQLLPLRRRAGLPRSRRGRPLEATID